jgi:predicted metalloprotease
MRGVLAVTVVALLASACAQESDIELNSAPTGAGELGEAGDGDQPETPDDLDDVVTAALNDVQTFWSEAYPDVYGSPFEPLTGGYHPYGPDTPSPPCGNPPPDYSVIADNAFYCPEADLIAWDEASLIPQLANDFGKFTVGIVFAHEFGHAIQTRAGLPLSTPTIISEQQADCFAGAWTKWIEEGNSDSFAVTETELDSSVAGMISISDLPGTAAEDPLAHGSGFDRISAFQDGFENSATTCAGYATDPPPTVEIPFDDDEVATGGNLQLEDLGPNPEDRGLLSLAEADLNDFYTQLFDELGLTFEPVEDLVVPTSPSEEVTCGGETLSGPDLEFVSAYCEEENIVLFDGQRLAPALNELGDFAVAAEIARLWARAAQIQMGLDPDGGKQVSLQADCITGFWAFVRFPTEDGSAPEGAELVLSPGDLDEGIQGFLAVADAVQASSGTVFERVDALRTGFVQGVDACNEYAPVGG